MWKAFRSSKIGFEFSKLYYFHYWIDLDEICSTNMLVIKLEYITKTTAIAGTNVTYSHLAWYGASFITLFTYFEELAHIAVIKEKLGLDAVYFIWTILSNFIPSISRNAEIIYDSVFKGIWNFYILFVYLAQLYFCEIVCVFLLYYSKPMEDFF